MKRTAGQIRAVVRNVYPSIEGGRFPIKRVVGETVQVWADVFADGHDVICAALQYRHEGEKAWKEVRAEGWEADRWTATFKVEKQGTYLYRFIGWADYALYWREGLIKKADAGVDVRVELMEGLAFLKSLNTKANKTEKAFIERCTRAFKDVKEKSEAMALVKSSQLKDLLLKYPNRPFVANGQDFKVYVDREKAVFSTWYEFFPRSASKKEGVHGTFKDAAALLPRIAEFGFDTLYFPPIHPIGKVNRKGKNNTVEAKEGDVGSCWGIGSDEGGHDAIHPQLGTEADFKDLVVKAKKLGIEVAMDFALQVAPDHPWVQGHPDWFKQRPDGSIQYAENPPKKYQDIYPIYFESKDWKAMWDEFLRVLEYWISLGVNVFRVDNPHTKPFGFWEWIIGSVKENHPDVIFLSEAFTRPDVMQELTKAGFTQSYSYFTWRNNKADLIQYMNELTQGQVSETFRPNFWPNTPDINPWSLQNPDEHQYCTRYFLAATLSSNCGVYGPVYELMYHRSVPGREEYWDSEKFQIRHWAWEARNRVTETYIKVNQARRTQRALQRTNNIRFLDLPNDQLMAYLKTGDDGSHVLCVVSLDGHNTQAGQLRLHPSLIHKEYHESMELKDLMDGETYSWRGDSHFVQLTPSRPFHLFHIT